MKPCAFTVTLSGATERAIEVEYDLAPGSTTISVENDEYGERDGDFQTHT